jgi:hypothetical protein
MKNKTVTRFAVGIDAPIRASSRASPTATSSRIAGSGTPVRLWHVIAARNRTFS